MQEFDSIVKDNGLDDLELGMQELEAMEAPGFYSGMMDGLTFTSATASVVTIALT